MRSAAKGYREKRRTKSVEKSGLNKPREESAEPTEGHKAFEKCR